GARRAARTEVARRAGLAAGGWIAVVIGGAGRALVQRARSRRAGARVDAGRTLHAGGRGRVIVIAPAGGALAVGDVAERAGRAVRTLRTAHALGGRVFVLIDGAGQTFQLITGDAAAIGCIGAVRTRLAAVRVIIRRSRAAGLAGDAARLSLARIAAG